MRGWSPNVVFFSCVRCRGGLGASPCFYVRTSVRPSVRATGRRPAAPPSELQNMLKRSKPFKINGLGPFWGTHLRSFVYINLKKYARMQRGVRFDTCPFCTGASYMGSEKRSKQFKINCLGCFGEAFFGGPIWTIEPAKTFPCSVALVFFFAGALPCSVALILQFLMFLVVPHVGPSKGVRNVIKTMLF